MDGVERTQARSISNRSITDTTSVQLQDKTPVFTHIKTIETNITKTDARKAGTLVFTSAPMTLVIGLIPSVLGMKRRREMTVDLGSEAT